MTDSLTAWLWLSSLTEVSPRAKAAVLEVFGTAEQALYAPTGAFSGIEGVSRREAGILEEKSLARAVAIPEACEACGARFLTIEDEEYPQRLREIYAPPVVLYVRGTLPRLDEEVPVAVIGTRQASPYGIKMGRSMAYELSKCGSVVVSGLTAGIDAAGAEGALAAGERCVGVLGTTIDAAKSSLARRVCLSGALISEYPPGTPQQKIFFRLRNRIAAGISCGVVAVEAPEVSGTRLFVAEALEQGKEIFAVPGNADSDLSAGTLRFLKEGAMLVTHGWDVAAELNLAYPGILDASRQEEYPFLSKVSEESRGIEKEETGKGRENKIHKKRLDKQNPPCYIDITDTIASLGEVQQQIMLAVMAGHSNAEEIIEVTDLPASSVLTQLTMLEIRGLIRRDAVKGIVIKQ